MKRIADLRLSYADQLRQSLLLPFSVGMALGLSQFAQGGAESWDAGGGVDQNWNTEANWTNDSLPDGNATINTGTALINDAFDVQPVDIFVGNGGGGDGRLDHTAGSVATGLGNWMFVGLSGGTGIYNLADTSGSGGTITGYATGTGSMTVGNGNGARLYIGVDSGSSGTVNVNTSGTLTVPWEIYVGINNGTGSLNMDSGVINQGFSGSNFFLGGGSSGGNGSVTIGGGTLNVAQWLVMAENGGTGTLTLSNTGALNQGANDSNSRLELTNPGSDGAATVNLNGGTAFINGFKKSGTGTAIVNFNGGTTKARVDNSDFLGGVVANVQMGGATFDTDGKSITIDEALQEDGSSTGGGLTKDGLGTLTLTAQNTFTGAVAIKDGTLYANRGNSAQDAVFSTVTSITVDSGATLRSAENSLFGYDGDSGTQFKPITINDGTMTHDDNIGVNVGVVNLNGGTISGTGGGTYGGWQFGRWNGSGSTLAVTEDSTVSATNTNFRNDATIDVAATKTLSFTGTIVDTLDGVSQVTKIGSGTLVLSGDNTYTDGTTISAGTLSAGNVTNNGNLGAIGGDVSLNGATATLKLTNTTAADGTFGTRVLDVGASGGTLNVNGAATSGQASRSIFDTMNTLTGSGALAITGNGSLDGFGGGRGAVVLDTQSQNYSGTITLSSGGILALENGATIAATTIELGNQSELSIGNSTISNNVAVTGGTASQISWVNSDAGNLAGTLTLNADVVVANRDWYANNTRSGTISGKITGSGNLTVTSPGAGTLTVNNTTSDFTGNIIINGGQVSASGGGGPTTSSLGSIDDAGTARSITVGNGTTLALTGGNVLGTGGSTNTLDKLTLNVNSGTFTTGFDGDGTTNGWWNKIGDVNLDGGTISVGSGANDSSFQGLSLIGDVNVTGSTASVINNTGSSTAAYNGIHLGQNNTTTNVDFNVGDVATGTDLTVSAKLIDGSNGGTNSSLTKNGAGTMLLNAANTYTGATNIDAGTLLINGDNSAATGAVTVASGATLGGGGTVGGDTTFEDGATHAVGNSPGLQTFNGTVNYNSNSIFDWELVANTAGNRGTDWDAVNGSSSHDLNINSNAVFNIILDGSDNGGSSAVDFANAFWSAPGGQSWEVFSGFQSVVGLFTLGAVTLDSMSQDYTTYGSFSLSSDSGSLSLTWTPVPEPTSALAGLLIGAGLLRRRRRAA